MLDEFQPPEQTMQPGDADIMNALHVVAHDFGGDGGFFGDRQVACAGADDGDKPGRLRAGFSMVTQRAISW